MTRLVLFAALLGLAGCKSSQAAPPPSCLGATLHYTQHEVSADGVVRDARWDERFVRCPGHVYRARILPEKRRNAGVSSGHEHDHGHLDLALVARHVVDGPSGARLELVDHAHELVVDVGKPEHESVGFDGSFDGAAHLVRIEHRLSMTRLDRPAPAGAVWLERTVGKRFQRILYSTEHDLVLSAAAGELDGTQLDTLDVEVGVAPTVAPWMGTTKYAHKEWADLGD